jgi:hypothetical protein
VSGQNDASNFFYVFPQARFESEGKNDIPGSSGSNGAIDDFYSERGVPCYPLWGLEGKLLAIKSGWNDAPDARSGK